MLLVFRASRVFDTFVVNKRCLEITQEEAEIGVGKEGRVSFPPIMTLFTIAFTDIEYKER